MTTATAATRDLQKYLDEGLWNGKGQKVICPVCGHKLFSLKSDKTLAKCFYPSCGFSATIGHGKRTGDYEPLYNILDEFRELTHTALLEQEKENWNHAYRYLTQERKIHPEVIRDSDIGIIPRDGEFITRFSEKFDIHILDIKSRITTLAGEFELSKEDLETIYSKDKMSDKAKIKEAFEVIKPLQKQKIFYQEARKKFEGTFRRCKGWILFFYTDHHHNIKSIKAREPYSKKILHFKPFKTVNGFFNHGLFSPEQKHHGKETLKKINTVILFEGEVNQLQIQSLTKRAGEYYIHAASWGGASNLNPDELRRTGWNPVICYDNDKAGMEVIERLQSAEYHNIDTNNFKEFLRSVRFEVFTTPGEGSDMDSFITGFYETASSLNDPETAKKAWQEVTRLFRSRQVYTWKADSVEFAKVADSNGRTKIILPVIGEYFLGTEHIISRPSKQSNSIGIIYRYDNGVYKTGNSYLRRKSQELLGNDTISGRISEILKYMETATSGFFPVDQNGNALIEGLNPKATELINLENGMLNWRTGELLPHHSKYLSTLRIPVTYNPEATCPVIDRFLETTFEPEVIPLIEELAGYLLIPELQNQKFILLYGGGGNGKSVFLRLLEALVGKGNTAQVSLRDLTENRFAKADLFGKLLNCAKEVSGYIKNTDVIKDITGGEPVQAEHKFQDTFKFTNFAKLIFSSNDLPTFDAKDEGLYRRMVIISFMKTFRGKNRDFTIGDKMIKPEELSGFLNRAISGLKRLKLQNYGDFTETEMANKALENFKQRNDNVAYFLSEGAFITGESEDIVLSKDLYSRYETFCQSYKIGKMIPLNRFKDRVLAVDSRIQYKTSRINGTQQRTFTGIKTCN